MDFRENYLRMMRFEKPASIPMIFHINRAAFDHYDESFLREQMAAHPYLFPDYDEKTFQIPKPDLISCKDTPWRDYWGSLWQTDMDGICGVITDYPLEDWAAFADFRMPDSSCCNGIYPVDFQKLPELMQCARAAGKLAQAGLPHGHTFLRYTYLRGFENTIFDVCDEPPELEKLLKMIETFNLEVLERCCAAQPDLIAIPEDLGMQHGPMISPDAFFII